MDQSFSGFDWDEGNREKCQRHGVSIAEIESLFDSPIVILPDEAHSRIENRMRAIGRTKDRRHVFVVFALRRREGVTAVRPISARYMHAKEVKSYEEENPDIPHG